MRAWEFHCRHVGAVIVRQHVPIPAPSMNEIADLIWSGVSERTRLIFLSHITSPTAIRLPVEEICRRAAEHNIPVFIDGAHAPAQIDLDLSTLGAAAYTGNFHKWACTPKGSAFLWVAPSFQKQITPFTVSWGDMIPTLHAGPFVDEHEYLGTRDISAFLTIPAGLDWLEDNQWSEERLRLRELKNSTMARLCQLNGIQPVAADWMIDDLLMGAVVLPEGTDVEDLKARLLSDYNVEVVVHRWLDVPILRFSVHLHTSNNDLDVLVRAMSEI
jgi:isopenicillin-N epimerase